MGIQNRGILKSFFKTGQIPTESNFSDLIDSFINQADEGLSATPLLQPVSGTLSIVANSNVVKGTNSSFLAELHRGDLVTINQGTTCTITEVTANDSFTVNTMAIAAITNGTATVKRDILAVLDAAGNAVFNVSGNGQTDLRKMQPALTVNGGINASAFTGDGSKLTALSSANLTGIIPKELIPQEDPINVSTINGLLTVNEAYDLQLPGTVSGEKGETILTAKGTNLSKLTVGQKISVATQVVEVLAIADDKLTLRNPLSSTVKDQPLFVPGSFLSLQNVDEVQVLNIDGIGTITTLGRIKADGFSGDGSELTSLSSANLKGLIPKEIIPPSDPINVSAISGLLTISEVYDQKLAGTVTGKSGEATLAGTGTDFKEIVAGQKIVVDTKTYEVLSREATTLTLKDNLTTDITDQPVFIAGSFLSLKDVNAKEILAINGEGTINTLGTLKGKSFIGDGAGLTNLSASAIEGVIADSNLPPQRPIKISEINGMLTITEAYDFQIAGKVSGAKDEVALTGTGTHFAELLPGQKIRVSTQVAEVLSIDGEMLTLKNPLTETVTDEHVYIAGNFLSLKDINDKEVVTIDAEGNVTAKVFTGNGSKLTDLDVAALKGVISAANLPPLEPSSTVNGQLTVNGAFDHQLAGTVSAEKDSTTLTGTGTNFKHSLSDAQKIRIGKEHYQILTVTSDNELTLQAPISEKLDNQPFFANGDFLSLIDTENRNIATINQKGDLYTHGTVTANKFAGDGFLLYALQACQMQGIVAPEQTPGYISLSCSKAVLNGEEKTTLTWQTRSLDTLIMEYPFNGKRELLSTSDLDIPSGRSIALQQPSFDLNLYQTTTITLTGIKKDVGIVAQQQLTITVIPNANQFTAQLKYEGYNLAYILTTCGARFGLDQPTDQNLLTLATAIKNNGYGKDEAVAAIRTYYQNGGQTLDASVFDLILNQVFDGDLQYQINNMMMQHDSGTGLPELLKAVSTQFNLSVISDQNVKYLVTGAVYTRRYSQQDIFRFIPQFFRSAGGEWLPQRHGVILLEVCSK